jgi:hypothetical protein
MECGAVWLPDDDERWRLYLGVEERLDDQPEVVWICASCAAVEFD